jgi:hypothetical protein
LEVGFEILSVFVKPKGSRIRKTLTKEADRTKLEGKRL